MNQTQEAFREALKQQLALLTTVIAKVYDYPADQFEGYPAVVVNSAGWDNSFSDTSRNRMIYHFELYLFQGINETTNEEVARKRIDSVSDAIIADLKSDVHLGGALLVSPVRGDPPGLVERPTQMIMMRMLVDFHSLTAR